jgi:hypothetical protein
MNGGNCNGADVNESLEADTASLVRHCAAIFREGDIAALVHPTPAQCLCKWNFLKKCFIGGKNPYFCLQICNYVNLRNPF